MQAQILGLLTPLMALLFAATFFALWRAGGLRRYVLGFGIGYLFFAAGYLLTHFLPGDAFYTFHATQIFYTVGVVFFTASTCERVGQQIHYPTLAGIYIVNALVLAIAVSATDDAGPRLILINIGYGAMFLVGLVTLLQSKRRDWLDLAIIALTAINVADFFIRPTLTVMYEQFVPAESYQQTVYYSVIGLVLGVKSIAGAVLMIGATIAEWTTRVRQSGERDPLTGMRNRGAFETAIGGMLVRAKDEDRALSLVIADIDHFKQVNDIWGHQAGDAAITGFADLIDQTVRGCDVTGRIGGEEFCIAVWNCPNEAAERLAERIRAAFGSLKHADLGDDIRLTASFGVASARKGEDYEQLFRRADDALYRAKGAGRNRVGNAETAAAVEAVLEPPATKRELFETRRTAAG